MKKTIPPVLYTLAAGVPIFLVAYTFAFNPQSFLSGYVIAAAIVSFAAFLLSFLLKNKSGFFLRSVSLIFSGSYLLAEIAVWFLLGFGILRPDLSFFGGSAYATDTPFGIYDTVSGFRGVPGVHRFFSADNGVMEIDHTFPINQQGWYSERNYSFTKKDSTVKRYMVLGDSYSAGLATGQSWCDMVQRLLDTVKHASVELYNFSLEGIGLVNWYRIFTYEILPKYEFDGIIIASASERNAVPNLDRKFFMLHSTEEVTSIQVLDVLLQRIPSSFPAHSAAPLIPVYNTEALDKIHASYSSQEASMFHFTIPEIKLCFLPLFYKITDGAKHLMELSENAVTYKKPYENYYKLAGQAYKMEYFDERYRYGSMLKEMISMCKELKKKVILINIPDYENAREYVKQQPVICREELQFLAGHYHIDYFDGFGIFEGKDEDFVQNAFYKYDRHWKPASALLFAHSLVESGVLF